MTVNIPLDSVRKEWLESFYMANVEQLNYIEADGFVVIASGTTISKSEQLHRISQLHKNGKWFDERIERVEKKLDRVDLGDKVFIYGEAELLLKKERYQFISFCEFWVLVSNRWKVFFLQYDVFF